MALHVVIPIRAQQGTTTCFALGCLQGLFVEVWKLLYGSLLNPDLLLSVMQTTIPPEPLMLIEKACTSCQAVLITLCRAGAEVEVLPKCACCLPWQAFPQNADST